MTRRRRTACGNASAARCSDWRSATRSAPRFSIASRDRLPRLSDLLGGGPFELPRGALDGRHGDGPVPGREPGRMRRFRSRRPGRPLPALAARRATSAAPASASASRPASPGRWPRPAGLARPSRARTIRRSSTRKRSPAWPRRCCSSWPSRATRCSYAAEAARTTHQSPLVLDACRYLAALLAGALHGAGAPATAGAALLTGSRDCGTSVRSRSRVAAIADGLLPSRKPPPDMEAGGTVLQTLEAALWALDRSGNFREGALLAVNLGLDADVTGAVYGQLAGALYGVERHPAQLARRAPQARTDRESCRPPARLRPAKDGRLTWGQNSILAVYRMNSDPHLPHHSGAAAGLRPRFPGLPSNHRHGARGVRFVCASRGRARARLLRGPGWPTRNCSAFACAISTCASTARRSRAAYGACTPSSKAAG